MAEHNLDVAGTHPADPAATVLHIPDLRTAADVPAYIGPYKILRTLGEGGMGSVYLAEQTKPIQRQVALKIIKLGMDTRQVITRFDAEREALAKMNHPNVASVIDAGATATGRPYFVMEYVDGIPLNSYCDAKRLSTHERLELFVKVCNAIQHAHHKGIIHRDIKPSNILVMEVDAKPVPKVIDFGIAKATEQGATGPATNTMIGEFMGTPAYMSPEQAEMSDLDIDTRSDVYSLGVVLYELLTGMTPFDTQTLRGAAIDEIRRIIREAEPSKPSTRLGTRLEDMSTIALHRNVEPKKLSTILRGDLDWIVMKALEKDRQRRYETANGLGMDIQRFLSGEPVLAAPPSKAYRLSKFVRRNKGVVLTGVAVAASLLIGMAGFAWQARIAHQQRLTANEQRDRARIEAAKSEKTTDFLKSIFGGIDPYTAQGMDTELLRKILGEVDDRITAELADQPEVEAAIRGTLGQAYTNLGQYESADSQLSAALSLQKATIGEESRQTLKTTLLRVILLERWGKHAAAEELAKATLPTMRRALGENDIDTLSLLSRIGSIQSRIGKFRESELNLRLSLERQTQLLGSDNSRTLHTMFSLVQALNAQSKYDEAEKLAIDVVERRKKAHGAEHVEVYEAMATLATVYKGQKRFKEAEVLEREALARLLQTHGPDNPQTLNVLSNLAFSLQCQGRIEEAESLFRDSLERRRRVLGDQHAETLLSIANLGAFLYEKGHTEEAEVYIRQGMDGRRRALGEDHRDTLASKLALARLLKDGRNYNEAAELLGQIVVVERKARNPSDPALIIALYNWAATIQDGGDHAAAEPILREVLAMHEKYHRKEEPYIAACWNALGRSMNAQGDFGHADEYFQKGLAMRRRLYPMPDRQLAYSLSDYGNALLDRGEYSAAEPLLRENLTLLRDVLPEGDWSIGNAMSMLGECLAGLSRFTEAESLLLDGYKCIKSGVNAKPVLVHEGHARVVRLYEAWEDAEPDSGKADALLRWLAANPEPSE